MKVTRRANETASHYACLLPGEHIMADLIRGDIEHGRFWWLRDETTGLATEEQATTTSEVFVKEADSRSWGELHNVSGGWGWGGVKVCIFLLLLWASPFF